MFIRKFFSNHSLSLKSKLIVRFSILFLGLFIAVQGIMLFSFRSISLDSSKARALSSASMILDALTSFMVMGGISKRDIFFEKIMDGGYGITRIRVLRGDAVTRQFGPPRKNEIPENDLEFIVLKTGELQERVKEDQDSVFYNLVIPYKAIPSKHANCLSCHKVSKGEILGAVSITYDLTPLRRYGLTTLLLTAISSLIFVVIMLYAIYRFFIPYNQLFDILSDGFKKVATGIFTPMSTQHNGNIRENQIAEDYNSMVSQLSGTLSNINEKAGMLVGTEIKSTGNVLSDTKSTVESLLDIYNFKRIIEKDQCKKSVYGRLVDIVLGGGISKFSIYEVDNQNHKIKIINSTSNNGHGVKSERLENDQNREEMIWCSQVILDNPTECRAMRTGNFVESNSFTNICPNFLRQNQNKSTDLKYRCLPLFIAGNVGNIIQFVFDESDEEAQEMAPILESYFQEAVAVLEGKTFMEMMRQQTLVDQLTGMYNRRFLDEISSNIQATARRKSSLVGILMIDVDFFKMVNDEHGHNVGDTVLKRVSAVIKDSIRDSDLAIRYGGEEMLVLLMDVEPEYSKKIAEKIRINIENEMIEIPGGIIKKTVSIGVCEFPSQTEKIWQSVKYSDLALYRAKESGRNQVIQFSEDLWPNTDY